MGDTNIIRIVYMGSQCAIGIESNETNDTKLHSRPPFSLSVFLIRWCEGLRDYACLHLGKTKQELARLGKKDGR